MRDQDTFTAGLFDELDVLYPDTDPETGVSTYRVAAAKGTYPGVHIKFPDLYRGLL